MARCAEGAYAITAKAVNTASQEQTSATSNITVKESTGGGGLVDNPDRSISYLTSWGLNDYEQLFNSEGDGYLLSFGKWDSSGNITISDGMLTPPDYNPDWMPTQYLAWSTLKHDNENVTMMVAFKLTKVFGRRSAPHKAVKRSRLDWLNWSTRHSLCTRRT